MGRTLSINNVDTQTFQILAGEQINENDLVQMGPDGKGYRVQGTNTAAVSNCTYGTAQTNASTGMIVAQTQVVANNTLAPYRHALLRGSDGSIYTFTAQNNSAASTGLMLSKYSTSGALLAKADIDTSSTAYYSHQMFLLGNGNICVLAVRSGTYAISFAIFTPELITIKSLSTIVAAYTGFYASCALSDGGFAVVFQDNTNTLLSKLITYDNAGNVVFPASTIWTRTGTNGSQFHQIAQLSDGNLSIAVNSMNTGASIGLFHGIVSISGGSVLSFTNLHPTSTTIIPELSVIDGRYAISSRCGSQHKAFVFSNDGLLQGAPFVGDGAALVRQQKLLNNGSNFFMIWPRSSDSKEVLTKIPVSGTGYITTDVTLAGTSQYSSYIDAFYEDGLIVVVSQAATANNSPPILWVIDAASGVLVNKAGTSFGVAPGTTSELYHRVIPGGDFSFICLYDYTATASTNLYIGKYANTAIMGVAKTSGAAGQLVSVTGESGGHAINKLAGPASVAFDHYATTTIGNKGMLMNHGVTLKGI